MIGDVVLFIKCTAQKKLDINREWKFSADIKGNKYGSYAVDPCIN